MSHWTLLASGLLAAVILASCSGPDDFEDPPATAVLPTPTTAATLDVTPDVSPASEATPSAVETAEPTATDEPETSPTTTTEPTPEPTSTEEVEPTATAMQVSAMEALPRLEELPEGGYVVADQGDRTAEQLAMAYSDSAAHLMRLDDWGFEQHVFREFSRNESSPDDPLPTYILATVNIYGSPEQADMALQWLEDYQVNQGATSGDAPDIGDAAITLTVATSQGDPTAWVCVRLESRVYIYFAQNNEPLPAVFGIAERVFERLSGGDVARAGWSHW